MEEMKNFMVVCVSVCASLSYSYYFIGRRVPKGSFRLLLLLPVLSLFLLLPLTLSSIHLIGITALFLSWLANFKLLLFAFGHGPLSSLTTTGAAPPMSLLRFISIACLPIKIKQDHHPINPSKSKSPLNYAIKGALLALVIRVYDYKHYYIHPKLVYILYNLHVYLILELILAMTAYLAKALLGLELEAQFNEPYLSTSLLDYWGRRWNITVASILRPTVYKPTQSLVAGTVLGRKWASLVAVLATFLVSGLMHELIFLYIGRTRPTWEITWYHVLHGFCLVIEISVKKALAGRWQLHRLVSGPLTIGFVMVTGYWLFFPQLLRCDAVARGLEEDAALIGFVKQVVSKARQGFVKQV